MLAPEAAPLPFNARRQIRLMDRHQMFTLVSINPGGFGTDFSFLPRAPAT